MQHHALRSSLLLIATIVGWFAPVGSGSGSAFALAQHLVRPGDDWSRLGEKLKPGDEILLFPGKHRPASFADVAGTATEPIVIRSVDRRSPITIEADDIGLELRRVSHLRVDGLVILNARRAGILVAGEPDAPAVDIEFRNVYVAKTGDLAERAGIHIRDARRITVRASRFEGWFGAGVHISAAQEIGIFDAEFIGTPATPDAFGVLVDGGSDSILIERCRFRGQVGSIVGLGLSAPAEPARATAPKPDDSPESRPDSGPDVRHLASQVTVERCLGDRVGRLATIGSARDVTLRANTISEPESGYEIVAPPRGWSRPTNVLLMANLFSWTPGTLKRLSFASPDVDPTGVVLEVNLWWSLELAAARSLLGEFVGSVRSPQILDVDPRFDGTFRPREERAKGFGVDAP